MHYINASDTPHLNVPSPGRDLMYGPNFSWQYLGYNLRPLMEGLCWILAAVTAGLHEATTGLHPQNGWAENLSEVVVVADGMDQDRQQISASRKRRGGADDERIVVGVVMERLGNHSPHRLVQGVLECMDRSKFRLVAFSRDYFRDYPDAGQAVLRAAEEVVVLEWHKFAAGLSDPFADRRLIAAAKVRRTVTMYICTLGSLPGCRCEKGSPVALPPFILPFVRERLENVTLI